MDALENAEKRSKDKVLEQIKALGIEEYGLCKESLASLLEGAAAEAQEEGKEPAVVAALNNADTDGVLLELLTANPEKIMEGISIAADALGTKEKILYIPEYAAELAVNPDVCTAAETHHVDLMVGLVNKREWKGCAIIHIVTAANLADAVYGKSTDDIYVSANGSSLRRVPRNTKIADLIGTGNVKAILAGYQYCPPETADLTLAEIEIANGVLRAITEKDCIVSETEQRLAASRRQSCGRCVFCREGLLQLQYMHKEIKDGKGRLEFLDLTKEIGEAMPFSTPCTMGQVSSAIALSAVALFKSEYEAHIRKKTCPASVCFSSEAVYINPKLCDGCGDCMDVCPKDCIEGKAKYIHMIDDLECDKCGRCMEVCPQEAIVKTSGKLPKLPDRLTKVGRFHKR